MVAVVIAFVCFYHAERILSAIAKFLVYLFGKGAGRAEIGVGRNRGREWGGKEEGRKWECTKERSKTQQICIWGRLLAATAPCHTF